MSFEVIIPFLKPIEYLLGSANRLRDHGQPGFVGLD